MTPADPTRRSSEWDCGTALEVAAGYVTAVRSAPDRAARCRAAASVRGAAAITALLRSLPAVSAPFSSSPAGAELRCWFRPDRRLPTGRVPVAVLTLPDTQAEYLRGRPRQALRTNVQRATSAGVTCTSTPSAQEIRDGVARIASRRGQEPAAMVIPRPRPGLDRSFSLAYDAAGDPVALSEIIVDVSWAGLAVLVTVPDGPAVRYLMHTHTVAELIRREVSTLTVGGSMLLTSAGTRYFQRRTGYVPVWLRLDGVATERRVRTGRSDGDPQEQQAPIPGRQVASTSRKREPAGRAAEVAGLG